MDRIRNETYRKELKVEAREDTTQLRQLRWFGLVIRMMETKSVEATTLEINKWIL